MVSLTCRGKLTFSGIVMDFSKSVVSADLLVEPLLTGEHVVVSDKTLSDSLSNGKFMLKLEIHAFSSLCMAWTVGYGSGTYETHSDRDNDQ